MIISEYDNTIEKQLNSLICRIDTNPKLIISPVEESSYLGINNYLTEEGFHIQVKPIYKQYLEYLDKFIEQNSSDERTYAYISSTLKRLLSKYQNAEEDIKESPLRIEWKTLSKHYTLPNPKNDFEIDNHIKYTKEAYTFFFKMSSVQLWFLGELIKFLIEQLNSFNKLDSFKSDDSLPKLDTAIDKEPVYVFRIKKEYSNPNSSHQILSNIHKNFKQLGYLDCKVTDFKKLFVGFNDKDPDESPTPII